jgi:hypothetical protein
MSSEVLIIESIKSLGIPGVLAALLFYLLRQANEERMAITKRFLDSMDQRGAQETEAKQQIASSIGELSNVMQQFQVTNRSEHERIMEMAKRPVYTIQDARNVG